MAHLDSRGIPHEALTPSAIHLGDDGIPRVDNLAVASSTAPPDSRSEIRSVAQALSVVLHRGMRDSAKADEFLKTGVAGNDSQLGHGLHQMPRDFAHGFLRREVSPLAPVQAEDLFPGRPSSIERSVGIHWC